MVARNTDAITITGGTRRRKGKREGGRVGGRDAGGEKRNLRSDEEEREIEKERRMRARYLRTGTRGKKKKRERLRARVCSDDGRKVDSCRAASAIPSRYRV